MRNDLPSMSPGRAMAQASHASNVFIHYFGNRGDVKQWTQQTKQGFGTAIVLGLSNEEITKLFSHKDLKDYITKGLVIDPDYVFPVNTEAAQLINNRKINWSKLSDTDKNVTYVSKSEVTCAYIFGKKEELTQYLGEFKLHP